MIQHAVHSFVLQDYPNRTLTVINDGAACQLSEAFLQVCRGQVLRAPPGTSIGEKRNLAARAVDAEFIASFDDDDFSLPSRLSVHVVCACS